jgi:hypothetical protein
LDNGRARVVRPVAERGLPALSFDLGQRRGFVSKENYPLILTLCRKSQRFPPVTAAVIESSDSHAMQAHAKGVRSEYLK